MNSIIWQRLEGALIFVAAMVVPVAMVVQGNTSWWQAFLVFFAADLGMLAYVFGPRIGAAVYNLLHLYVWGFCLAAASVLWFGAGNLSIYGLLWLAHVGFDRMLGYGLKEPTAFFDTHLGRIGR